MRISNPSVKVHINYEKHSDYYEKIQINSPISMKIEQLDKK